MHIELANISDADAILAIQKSAYQSEARIYNDFSLPPLLETPSQIRVCIEKQVVLKAVNNQSIIGSVRGYQVDDTCYIGRLVVLPEFQNRGIGKSLMMAIESHFPLVKRFELFTGHLSNRNIYLYEKLGFKIFRTEVVHDSLSLVYMEKPVPGTINRPI